jgi:CRISPR/Cas system-associated protein Cas7 (RAMP superfamily)
MPKMPVLEKAGQGANIFYQAGKVGRVTAPAGKTETMPTMTPEEEKQKRIDDAILKYAPSYEKIKQKRTQVSPGNAFSKVSKVSKGSFV